MWAHRLRSILSLVGIAIGIGAVILLTAIGEGTRYFVLAQFTQFGTNILAIQALNQSAAAERLLASPHLEAVTIPSRAFASSPRSPWLEDRTG